MCILSKLAREMLSYYLGDAAVQTGLPCRSLIAGRLPPQRFSPPSMVRAPYPLNVSVGKSQREHHRPFNRLLLSFSKILATVFPKAKLRRFDFFEQTRCRILFEGRAYRLLNEMAQESPT
jgi:hypothetical protein